MLTRERLKELLDYEPDTGVFRWRTQRSNVMAGAVAGTLHSRGYVEIKIDGRLYKAHRLAFLWVEGVLPPKEVDHKNQKRSDNRWENLRHADGYTNSQNKRQARKDNKTSGLLGASWKSNVGKFVAQIGVSGRKVHLGYFSTAEDAHRAYIEAKRKFHAGCLL